MTSGDETIKLWDFDTGRERLIVPVPTARHWIRFSADGQTLIHLAAGMPLEVWETRMP